MHGSARYGWQLKLPGSKQITKSRLDKRFHPSFIPGAGGGSASILHTFPDLNGVYELLDRLREDSAAVVNRVFTHMKNRASLPATPKTTIDLLFDFAKALDNSENARTLLSILTNKGSIDSQGRFQTALQKLRQAGILQTQTHNRRRTHVVTAQYQHPLEMLLRHGSYPHLTARHRTRNPQT